MQVVEKIASLTASTALGRYLRVKYDATNGLAVAGPEDRELGTTNQRHIVAGLGASKKAPVLLRNAPGTRYMIAAGAFSAWDVVYGAEGGKIDDTPNSNPVGVALEGATADGDEVEVLYLEAAAGGLPGDAVPGIEIEDDFIGDWDAAGTALTATKWTKTETNGLGVTSVDVANGILKFAADAVSEAATATLFMENSPFDIDKNPIFHCILAIYDIGDNAAVDFDFGLASDDHATDFESIAAFAAFHLDGSSLVLKVHSDDGTNDNAPATTGVTLVDETFYEFKIDMTDTSDVKFLYRAVGAPAWTQLNSSTTYDMSNYTANLTPIWMVEKTTDDSAFDMRLDWARCRAERS